jgi:CheY-like chemotaxis protein
MSSVADGRSGGSDGDSERTVVRAGEGRFAAAGRDLRQPLAALSLLVEVLDGRLHDKATRDVLRTMRAAVQSMHAKIEGHLDLARIEAGVLEPDIGDHPANGILTRLAMEFTPAFADQGLPFVVLPCSAVVRTDAVLVERITRSFLDNALRGTGRGRVILGCRRRGQALALEVWDSGPGLPADQLATLRTALARVAGGGSCDGPAFGLGLGLTLAAALAGRLGHRVEVDSRPGRGTRFALVLGRPVSDAQALGARPREQAAGEQAPRRSCRGQVHVLVIEDDPTVLEALRALLRHWGCAVSCAAGYDDAAGHLGSGAPPPDLVIADLCLAGPANGIVVIRRIAKALDRPLPGLILTGETDPRRLREARLSGYSLLQKPVAPLALRTALARLLGQDRLTA